MPEYLAPGVYVEETSFRAKSIEGVGTSTTGFVGATRYGPVAGEPELMTSFGQFERIYGGLDLLNYPDNEVVNYLAHAVRAFFDNGGARLYVARAYTPPGAGSSEGKAQASIPAPAPVIDRAESLITSRTASALFFLSQAIAQAQKAKAAAMVVLRYAAEQVLDSFTIPVSSPLNYDYGASSPIEDQLDAKIAEQVQDTTIFTAALRTLVQDADEAYGEANRLLGVAAGIQSAVAGAATAGVELGKRVLETALPADATAAAAAAITPLETAVNATVPAVEGLDTPSTVLDTTLAALADNTTATAVVSAVADLNTAANSVMTASANVVGPIRNTAEAVTVGRRASLKNADALFIARFPGAAGNLRVTVTGRLAANVLSRQEGANTLTQLRSGDLVVIHQRTGATTGNAFIYMAMRNGDTWSFTQSNGSSLALAALTSANNPADSDDLGDRVFPLSLTVQVETPGKFSQARTWSGLTTSGSPTRLRDSLIQVFGKSISNRMQELETPLVLALDAGVQPEMPGGIQPAELAGFLLNITDWHSKLISRDSDRFISTAVFQLRDGSDGQRPNAESYRGREDGDTGIKSGLIALEDLEEISIVAAPGYSHDWTNDDRRSQIRAISQALITHCENMRYRVAVLDSPNDQSLSGVREYRALLDTTRAVLYYPWLRILDPVSDQEITVPPSGFMAGIYARNDVQIGVHKAPANEVVRGAIGLETLINKAQQDVLNPLGINCIRFFEGRGIRVWGARTVSSDPEWKYLNIRRYFVYLEASIDRATQWAVFEPNGDRLWANVRRAVESFLETEWRDGRLAGAKVEEAFFVRCDRSTMTQNDLDNGRMICLIGVSPLYPAEFVIFRIGQWTADRRA